MVKIAPSVEAWDCAVRIYFDFNDWWIGYYKGYNYHFICPLPTVVIRWKRKSRGYTYTSSNDPERDAILGEIYKQRAEILLRPSWIDKRRRDK